MVPDLPGFGCFADARGPFTVAATADHVQALMERRGVRDHVLVGHSMGGKVALVLAARRMPGLKALILLAPSPPMPEPISEADRAKLIAGWGSLAMAEHIVATSSFAPLAPELRMRAIDDVLRSGELAWNAWLSLGSREDISPLLPQIAAPTTVLSGDHDTNIPTPVLRGEVCDRLAGAKLRLVSNAGHLLPLEVPDVVATIIMECTDPPANA